MGTSGTEFVALLWQLRERPTRGPKPSLTLERIAAAAIAIADSDGLDALSMQRVATDLGLTKMALYRYVAGRDELVALMVDAAVGDPPNLAGTAGGWRIKLTTYARLLWETWDRHPWIPGATVGARVMGPNEVGWVESAVRVLAETGLDGPAQLNAVQLLSGHIRNAQAGSARGSLPWSADHHLDPAMADLLYAQRDRYPAVTAAVDGAADTGTDARTFGLDCILDGLEMLIRDAR
ncbi:TetR/AcrR family transcriptional regulator [Virgisporangium aurantiacum]|uniref:TetR family transcriptional regulator n=1 Tax=Virgisporangium aurantiacum TaxID=175570 RepID=A0A8J3ZFK3_9ACTN|nr:TetR/AcrR family transcriptional regulator C-terminal domain-containing protein [Virgisporangium aurantiacum]GIJ63029.1 TetR family transcriptional regulator [Virgisporangium aurantiacum]